MEANRLITIVIPYRKSGGVLIRGDPHLIENEPERTAGEMWLEEIGDTVCVKFAFLIPENETFGTYLGKEDYQAIIIEEARRLLEKGGYRLAPEESQ
jgi:hypothetical protein